MATNAITLNLLESGVAVVTLDLPDSKVNLLSESMMRELNDVLDRVQANPAVKGLVITSGKPDNFIAGANINEIKALSKQGAVKAYEGAKMGKMILDRIEALPFTTVAAINGICLGGGTEMTLACNFRLASKSAKTKIGLPEIQLGILPGWGGTVRLPKLIGLQQALTIITTGIPVEAKKAWRLGLVDELVDEEGLVERAVQVALGGHVKRSSKLLKQQLMEAALEGNPLGRKVLTGQALALVKAKSRGYIAPLEAAKLILATPNRTAAEAYEAESLVFGRLAVSDISRNLVGIFFGQTESKRMPEKFAPGIKVRKVGVLGAGVMGAGIAQAAAFAGYQVVLKDIKPEFVEKGINTIKGLFDNLVEKGKMDRAVADGYMASITGTCDYADLSDCDLVVEAVLEVMSVKQESLAALEQAIAKPFIFATNTSSLSVTELASVARHPGNVVGVHFFNPVHKMPLVEIVRTETTTDETVNIARAFAMKLGKTTVLTNDAPGFVVNRILAPYMLEAVRLADDGVPMADIDKAMKDFGMPMGPFELLDEVGLDIAAHVVNTMHGAFGARFAPPHILSVIRDLKILGKKGKKGIYLYGDDGNRLFTVEKTRKGLKTKTVKHYTFNPDVLNAITAPRKPKTAGEIQDRLVLAMVNEAARIIQDGVVDDPAQLDLAMIFGTGFPPYRGGVLRYADDTGVQICAQNLTWISIISGENYVPCQLLVEKAAAGEKFYLS